MAADILDDPLRERLAELAEYDTLLTTMETCAQRISAALETFGAAQVPLLELLSKSYDKDSSPGRLVSLLCSQLAACAEGLQKAETCAQALASVAQEERLNCAGALKIVEQRNTAWVQMSLRGGARDEAAARDYRAARRPGVEAADGEALPAEAAAEALDRVLARRWRRTAAALKELCLCHTMVLDRPRKLSDDLKSSASSLAQASTSPEALVAPRRRSPPLPPAQRFSEAVDDVQPGAAALSNARPDAAEELDAAAMVRTLVSYRRDDKVQVWSNSQKMWLEGTVLAVYDKAGTYDNYQVPAGVIKVESASGLKFIERHMASEVLRKCKS